MSIFADCHLHSHHSADSEASMEAMVLAGIENGLKTMCFTEHNDFAMPNLPDYPGTAWELNADSYLYELLSLKEKYADKIRLLFGVEIGMQEDCMREDAIFAKSHEFDFVIGSVHVVRKMDPYYPSYFEGRSPEEAYREYFETELTNIKKHSNFDVLGHLDYVVRYGSDPSLGYDVNSHMDIIDAILKTLLSKEKGLELNTGGIDKGMPDFHPCIPILKRYKELGGEIITIGSDAHAPTKVGKHFARAGEILKSCGFDYYCVFEKRTPEFHKI